MKKASIITENTAAMIILVAVFIVLIVWWTNMQSGLNDTRDIEACRASVQAYAFYIDSPGPDARFFDVDCERRIVTFTDDKVEMNGDTLSYYDVATGGSRKSYRQLDENIINSVAASELSICWYQFLEGKVRFGNTVDLFDNQKSCFICSELNFNVDEEVEFETTFFNWTKLHDSRPYPRSGQEARPTYFHYLYEEDRICDNSRWRRYGLSPVSQEQQNCMDGFFKFLTEPPQLTAQPQEICDEVRNCATNAPAPDLLVNLMSKNMQLTTDKSYMVMFYWMGQDAGTTEDGKPTGASYAPVLIERSRLNIDVCGAYIG